MSSVMVHYVAFLCVVIANSVGSYGVRFGRTKDTCVQHNIVMYCIMLWYDFS